MPTYEFTPTLSTNEIFRENNTNRFLTNDLIAIENGISALESGKAPVDHTHTGFAATDHTHTGFASESHTHTEYAPVTHAHSGYAPTSHTHDGYFAKTGGDIDGNVNIKGIVRVNGKQMIFDSGTMSVFGTNNQATQIAGSQVYSSTAITVSSDERLKRDICALRNDTLAEFINDLLVVSYNYKTDEKDAPPRIGLIAQDVQNADPEIAKYFVTEDANGMLGLRPADLVFPLIAAVQHLSQEVETLRKQIQK